MLLQTHKRCGSNACRDKPVDHNHEQNVAERHRYFYTFREAVADYGAHYSSYCKLWGLVVADLVYGVQDKLLFCRELHLQPIGGAHNAPDFRGVFASARRGE